MSPFLKIDSLSAGYDDNIVLQDINLTVYKKDFLGVIGPNGSGKTTLIKVILGLIKPVRGEISFFNNKKNTSHSIGYLPQKKIIDYKFPISVFDVVSSGLSFKTSIFSKHLFHSDKNKIEELLTKLKISHLKKKSIGELSGGQAQRVFLCRALASDPQLLILDEPDTFIDKTFSRSFYEILKELNKKMTIILVSHDIGIISSYVKNIACINRTLHYHPSGKVTTKLLENYNCPVDIIAHGKIPHRVLKSHGENNV